MAGCRPKPKVDDATFGASARCRELCLDRRQTAQRLEYRISSNEPAGTLASIDQTLGFEKFEGLADRDPAGVVPRDEASLAREHFSRSVLARHDLTAERVGDFLVADRPHLY